jgi:antitoxin (DNA-binding transcriptional repressor) of toxin-antitoxin stability system
MEGGLMKEVTVAEAQQRLAELLAAAESGEVIEIRADNGHKFRIAAVRPGTSPTWPGYPKAGSCKGMFKVPDDFDAPLEAPTGG